MPITDTHALRQAGRLFSKAVFNQKIPIKTIRSNYDSILGTVSLPNNIDKSEVDVGPVQADMLIPELAIGKRTILYAHGGSFISGSRLSARNLCASLAHESASKLLLPEYRLAPEHPFPAGLDDMFASYMWLLRQGIPSGDIIFAGDGTGANLMLSLVHLLGDKRINYPAAVIAISPWVDLACESAIFAQRKNPDPIFTREILANAALQYTVQSDFSNPLVSPIHGDFSLFPHLYIQCGSEEILLDDAERLARKAENAGIPVTLDIEKGMWHLFQSIDSLTPRAHTAVKKIGQWVRDGSYGSDASGKGNH